MRLTCHDCGSAIYISAEEPNCPSCGTELGSYLRALEYVRECYQQASEETLAGDHDRALSILAQGLSAVNASELHLLAALIHRKQGEYDGMLRHVAAIPVDDPLRSEGEWLLRSHQQKQRAVRQSQKEFSPPAHAGKAARQLSPEFYSVPPTLSSPLRPRRTSLRRFWRVAIPLVVLALMATLLRQPLAQGIALLTSRPNVPAVAQQDAIPPITAVVPPAIDNAATAQSNAAVVASPQPAEPTAVPTEAPTPLPTATPPLPTPPLPTATPLLPMAAEPEPLAAGNAALV
ncbi:MAG: hypothetical protein WAU10_02820, partial [Caldilineaceae bacterium]